MSPLELGAYEAQRWRKLAATLTREEVRNLRNEGRLEYAQARKPVQAHLVELAKIRYWRDRQRGEMRTIRWSWVQEKRLRLVPAIGPTAREGGYVVAVIPKPGEIAPGKDPLPFSDLDASPTPQPPSKDVNKTPTPPK
jgi:hypothetical protein